MIKEFVEKWDKYKKDLEDYFRNTKQGEYDTYEEIVKALFEKVIKIAQKVHAPVTPIQ